MDGVNDAQVGRYGPNARSVRFLVLFEEVLGGSNVWRNGFLAEDVLVGGECCFDERGLDGDWKGDNESLNVLSSQEVVESVVCGGRVVKVGVYWL